MRRAPFAELNRFGRLAAAVAVLLAVVMLFSCAKTPSGERPDDTFDPVATSTPGADEPAAEERLPVEGGVLKLSVGPFDTINPLLTNNEDIRVYAGFVCEMLVVPDSFMEPTGNVLREWVHNEEFTVWEFTVADGIVFHDGSAVEASDVKRVIDYIIARGGNYAANVENVAGCFAKDEKTLQLVLKEPDAHVPEKLAIPLVGWQTLAADRPVLLAGTGIFKQKDLTGQKLTLEKNADYRNADALTHFDNVEITFYESEDAKLRSDFDMALFYGSSVGLSALKKDTKVQYYTGSVYDFIAIKCSSTYLISNPVSSDDVETGEEKTFVTLANAFASSDMRRALNLLTSRQEAVNAAASGHGTVSLLPLYSGTVYRRQNQEDYPYNPVRAQLLMNAAGYTKSAVDGKWYDADGNELIVRAISPKANFRMGRTLRQATNALKEIGVTVELEEIGDDEYLDRLRNKEYMLAAVEIELGTWQSVEKILKTDGELNFTFYGNSRIDDYIEQIETIENAGVILAAYNEIEKIVLEDNPIAGMFIADNAVVLSGRLQGFRQEAVRPWNILATAAEWWIEEPVEDTPDPAADETPAPTGEGGN
ncbi:MAG: ABC transporter substrate-binding protein [Clostridia bacterium]|nr:ABC transporter substrate-binding protein [Clostridia bacterium]